MFQRIFEGDFTPGTMIVIFLIMEVVKVLLLAVIGPVAFFPNIFLSFVIGFGLVRVAMEQHESGFFIRALCWLLAFTQIGTLAMVGI